ncbi:MAG: hypothetical protein VW840_18550 [Gammaproteobacteria bacterium]
MNTKSMNAKSMNAKSMNAKSMKYEDLHKSADLKNGLMGEQLSVVPLAEESANVRRSAEYHSAQAMAAARQMRSSHEKGKTGQIVCHHLRMMLTTEPGAIVLSAAANEEVSPESDQSQYQLGF